MSAATTLPMRSVRGCRGLDMCAHLCRLRANYRLVDGQSATARKDQKFRQATGSPTIERTGLTTWDEGAPNVRTSLADTCTGADTRQPFTKVPLVDPRSTTYQPSRLR